MRSLQQRGRDLLAGLIVGVVFGPSILLRTDIAPTGLSDFFLLGAVSFFMIGWIVAALWCVVRPVVRRLVATQGRLRSILPLLLLVPILCAAIAYSEALFVGALDDGGIAQVFDSAHQVLAFQLAWQAQLEWCPTLYALVAIEALVAWRRTPVRQISDVPV